MHIKPLHVNKVYVHINVDITNVVSNIMKTIEWLNLKWGKTSPDYDWKQVIDGNRWNSLTPMA